MALTTFQEMIAAKFLWGNVLLGGKQQKDAKNSNFKIFESALYMKSVSMSLIIQENQFSHLLISQNLKSVESIF